MTSVRTRYVTQVLSAPTYLDPSSVSALQASWETRTKLDVEVLTNVGLIETVVQLWPVWLMPGDTGNVSILVTSLNVDQMPNAM